jgi:hypothetical protein
LDQGTQWAPFFEVLANMGKRDLLAELTGIGLIDGNHIEAVSKLRRSAEGRSVPLPGPVEPTDEVFTLLAAGFAKGEPGRPAIPYARIEG